MQINEVVETASLVPNDTCMYPNGRLSGKLVACDNPATTKIDGRSYCESHTGMVERGCLDTTVCMRTARPHENKWKRGLKDATPSLSTCMTARPTSG